MTVLLKHCEHSQENWKHFYVHMMFIPILSLFNNIQQILFQLFNTGEIKEGQQKDFKMAASHPFPYPPPNRY